MYLDCFILYDLKEASNNSGLRHENTNASWCSVSDVLPGCVHKLLLFCGLLLVVLVLRNDAL